LLLKLDESAAAATVVFCFFSKCFGVAAGFAFVGLDSIERLDIGAACAVAAARLFSSSSSIILAQLGEEKTRGAAGCSGVITGVDMPAAAVLLFLLAVRAAGATAEAAAAAAGDEAAVPRVRPLDLLTTGVYGFVSSESLTTADAEAAAEEAAASGG